MEVTSSAVETTTVVEIPISSIKVNTRLRATDHDKVRDIAESVEGLGRLLHPICVSNHGDEYHLLSGLHRLESFKYLNAELFLQQFKKQILFWRNLLKLRRI